MNPSQMQIPADAVMIDGVAPEVGDTVNFQVEARVTGVDGKMIGIEPMSANGKPLTAAPAAQPAADDMMATEDQDEEELRRQAEARDAKEEDL
jgi:ribosomal protein L12E/L44/L45/RPP1/RPP2